MQFLIVDLVIRVNACLDLFLLLGPDHCELLGVFKRLFGLHYFNVGPAVLTLLLHHFAILNYIIIKEYKIEILR